MKRIPITKIGYQELKTKIEKLKTIDRPKVIKAIEEARAHGDLSENAEYNAAKEKQSFIESKIIEIEYKLSSAEIIENDNLQKSKAVFACRVILENTETGDEVEYQLVGSDESNIEKGRISVTSPLGKAIIGKKPGDEIILEAPIGRKVYELLEIL